MLTIVAAILSGAVGCLGLWYFKFRPQRIIVSEKYRRSVRTFIPEIKFLYKDIPVTELGILELTFENNGLKVIPDSIINIELDENIKIIGVSHERTLRKAISPNQKRKANKSYTINFENNPVKMKVDHFFPRTHGDKIDLSIFTEKLTTNVRVLGGGVFADNTPWSVVYKSNEPPPIYLFFDAFGIFIKKTAVYLSIISMLFLVYLFGYSGSNLLSFFQNLPFNAQPHEMDILQIPTEEHFAVLVSIVENKGEVKAIINQLLKAEIKASRVNINDKFAVYIGGLETRTQADSVLSKIRIEGFMTARIIPKI